jgi:hypothetical protein
MSAVLLQHNPLYLIEGKFIAPAIVELRHSCRSVVRHGGSVFKHAAVLKIGGDASRAESVIADECRNASGRCATADHGMRVLLG